MNQVSALKSLVINEYAERASESDDWYPYCFASQNDINAYARTRAMGYSLSELESVPAEAMMGLGCGNPVASAALQSGEIVLDVGSGGGLDVFLASKQVGPEGMVIGLDVTRYMVIKSRTTAARYRYRNVEFAQGDLENIPLTGNSFDTVMSNCVINLSVDKTRIFEEIFRIIKPGGKLVISDTALVGELPEKLRYNPQAWTHCIAGAMRLEEYPERLTKAGFQEIATLSVSEFDFAGCQGMEIAPVICTTISARKV
ncbi:MAG: arsenite methyltransferase [Dehalococcoidia bacterium]